MTDGFYRALEERYYAPRSVIRTLRQQYMPFIEPLAEVFGGEKILDLGCGRGEWLELMKAKGFDVFGVDLDEGMLQDCYALGLPAAKGDAVQHLRNVAQTSQVMISAFHVIEHISFDCLRAIAEESYRVLKPGGLLLLETPNPENIRVATKDFYIDPTHQRLVPQELLTFLLDYYGYKRLKVFRFPESGELLSKARPTLLDVLYGASQNYAVVAQKEAAGEIMQRFDTAFASESGVSLETLAERFERRIIRLTQLEALLERIRDTWGWRKSRKIYQQVRRTFR